MTVSFFLFSVNFKKEDISLNDIAWVYLVERCSCMYRSVFVIIVKTLKISSKLDTNDENRVCSSVDREFV